jgi:thiamine biosynthesis protein ThiS
VTSGISVRVNGEARDVPAGMTVREMLRSFDLEPSMIVVEHNGDIVRRERYDEIAVREGDAFELVHFVGGG